MAAVFDEHAQKPLLCFGKLHRHALAAENHARKVKMEGTDAHRFLLRALCAQLHSDARPEHRQRERLGDIIVGASLQPHNLIHLHVVGCEQDHRRLVAVRAPVAQKLQTARIRQIDIQKHQVKTLRRHCAPRFRSRLRSGHRAFVRVQRQRNATRQRRVILHEQNAFHRCPSLSPVIIA